MSRFEHIRREVVAVWVASAYFAVCFSTILLFKKLMLAQYHIEFSGFGKALVGALLVGKVVVVLNGTSFGRRLHRRAVVWDVLYRSAVYTFYVAVVLIGEKLWHASGEHPDIMAAALSLFDGADGNRIEATLLCILLSFVSYHFFSEFDRYLGRERMLRFLFSAEETPPTTPG